MGNGCIMWVDVDLTKPLSIAIRSFTQSGLDTGTVATEPSNYGAEKAARDAGVRDVPEYDVGS